MTREEAREILTHNWTRVDNPNYSESELDEAFFMAIEALSESSGDLISRADAMTEFREWVKRANENGETPTWNDAVSLIGSLPSAKLNNPCNSLLTDESNGSKEHKSKLDLISRADAIKAIRKCKFESDMPSYWYRGMEDAQDIIKDIPSADAVHGEWIMHIDDLFPEESTQECSNCHEHETIKIRSDNFCPNCGAKMDGERREP